MQNWIDALPERLDYEVEAFASADGLDFELDAGELATNRRVVFHGTLTINAREPVALTVRYPESFPVFRPEVFAPELKLGRHQNPYRHNLCLLERSTRHWNPDDTGAWLVGKRIPLLLGLLEGDPEELRRAEAPQGEPASFFFVPEEQTAAFVPAEMLTLPAEATSGAMYLAVGEHEQLAPLLRVGLSRVCQRDSRGKSSELARASGGFATRFSKTAYEGRWVRLPAFPSDGGTADHLWAAAREVPGYEKPPLKGVAGAQMRVLGVVCQEEVRQGVYEDTWLFAVELYTVEVTRQGKLKRRRPYITCGSRLGPEDLAERIPSLAGLPEKTIALSGLGALGGPAALELARAQVGELRVLDPDVVEAGTIVRWPFGLSVVGHSKVGIVCDLVPRDYPFTRVVGFHLAVGAVAEADSGPDASESAALTEFFDGADLLLDATAEIGVQQLLSLLADEAGIPQVYVTATAGGRGGIVARVIPGTTGCWWCLQRRLEDGSIEPPPAAPSGTVQPRGCATPTWTGTSFDALPLVAQAVRTASFTLLGERPAEGADDVFVCSQKAQTSSELSAPKWTSYPLEVHPDCKACASR